MAAKEKSKPPSEEIVSRMAAAKSTRRVAASHLLAGRHAVDGLGIMLGVRRAPFGCSFALGAVDGGCQLLNRTYLAARESCCWLVDGN